MDYYATDEILQFLVCKLFLINFIVLLAFFICCIKVFEFFNKVSSSFSLLQDAREVDPISCARCPNMPVSY